METSLLIKSTHRPLPSPDGRHLASIQAQLLEIRRISTLDIVRSIPLPASSPKFVCLRWSPISKATGASSRLLAADEDSVRVFDLDDVEWSATIDNGSGGMGKIANVEFGGDDTEVVVYSAFQALATVWNLWSGRSVEIKDPKFAAKSHARNRTFALLSRPAAQDIITLHAPTSYAVLKSFALPTADAQGMKWSPDGRWLAVWDAASSGYKVLIYTADGNLYRTYAGDYFEENLTGLGVKSIEWSPSGDFLAIGAYERTVTLLSTRTVSLTGVLIYTRSFDTWQFSPAVHLAHCTTVSPYNSTVFVEQVASVSPSSRSYTVATSPVTPPAAIANPSSTTPQIGTSVIAFNSTGSLVATKSDAHPTTVWIWDLSTLRSRAIFVQHSVVKRMAWHHADPDLLLIQCIQGDGALYVWNARNNDMAPRVLALPEAIRLTGKADARWLPTGNQKKPAIVYSDMAGCAFVWPEGREPESPQLAGSAGQAVDEDDSLFEILSGKEATGAAQDDATVTGDFDAQQGMTLQDTFDFRQGVRAH